jgi:hypothetical protein
VNRDGVERLHRAQAVEINRHILSLDRACDHRHLAAARAEPAATTRSSCCSGRPGLVRRSAMMAAPPCDQHDESADDSENGSFRHFLTHLVCMRERLIDCDLRDSGLVTKTYRGRARARSQSICSSVCVISNPEAHHQRSAATTARIFCFDIILFRLRMSEVISFAPISPAGSSRCHCASAGFAGATKERIACPSSELDARGKRSSRCWPPR